MRRLGDGVVEGNIGRRRGSKVASLFLHGGKRRADPLQIGIGPARCRHFCTRGFHDHAEFEELGEGRAAIRRAGDAPRLSARRSET
ncbi:hypothetical protein AWV79_28055 [Cupriavidus sp. UYMMa02A]|nr:hypothetical protein AWV79_28055 [Cupriavidus sp. UYMMa02A]